MTIFRYFVLSEKKVSVLSSPFPEEEARQKDARTHKTGLGFYPGKIGEYESGYFFW